ncbi:MAG: hypothetical protein FWG01_04830 [Betaproteobacteria bacterium]|nr:hypothetical protein [Betaproteobacteria bacterium]
MLKILGILFVFAVFSPSLFAANFRCGLSRTETTLTIPRPPDVQVLGRNIQVVIGNVPGAFTMRDQDSMRQAIQQALVPDFIVANNNPEVIFTVHVTTYNANIREYTQTEKRRIVVGQDCKKDDKGKEKCTDKYENREVPVKYWEANVPMAWRVEVADSSGKSIDYAFSPGDTFNSKKELSVAGKPSSSSGGLNDLINSILGNAAANSTELPDEQAIRSHLIANTARKFTSRYRKTYDSLKVYLACDKEFSDGNKLIEDSKKVTSKDWAGALSQWEIVKLRKPENESGRLYNMAVAYEALAFKAFDVSGVPEDADPNFDKALGLYQQAMTMDPKEKYIQDAANRLRVSKSNLGRARLQRDTREREEQMALELAIAEMEEEIRLEEIRQQKEEARLEAMARPEDEDFAEERNFRTYVRARFGTRMDIDDEELEKLSIYGQERLKLDEDQAWRVVDQEVERLKLEMERRINAELYREDFELFVAKGVITKDDRSTLNAIAESLSLTANEVKAVESAYKFKDESIATPGAKR